MSGNNNDVKPVDHDALTERRQIPAEGTLKDETLSVVDISLEGVKGTNVIQEEGRLRVVATLDGKGGRRERRHERIPAIPLNTEDIDRKFYTQEIRGYRPSGMPTSFKPESARPTPTLPPQKG